VDPEFEIVLDGFEQRAAESGRGVGLLVENFPLLGESSSLGFGEAGGVEKGWNTSAIVGSYRDNRDRKEPSPCNEL
jgi:hypothetical protein